MFKYTLLIVLFTLSACSQRSKYCPKLASEIQLMIEENNDNRIRYRKASDSLLIPKDDYIHSETIKALSYYYIDLCEYNKRSNY